MSDDESSAQFTFAEDWLPYDDAVYERELQRELCEQHVLFGCEAKVVARHIHEDDYLFRLPDGRFAIVHLTWRRETDPAWPYTQIFASTEQLRAEIQRDMAERLEMDDEP